MVTGRVMGRILEVSRCAYRGMCTAQSPDDSRVEEHTMCPLEIQRGSRTYTGHAPTAELQG